MSDELKYWVRCIGIYVITVLVFMYMIQFGVKLPAVLVGCLWAFEISQVVNLIKGIRKYISAKWNVVSFVLFVVVSLGYIIFCGWYFTVMAFVVVFGILSP